MKPLEKNKKNDQRIIPMDPMSVGTLEEIIDDNYEIVSTSLGSEHHISILSFVDNDLLEWGCSVLLSYKVHAVIGVLMDDTDPLLTVMKVEKVPQEPYADIGVWTTKSRNVRNLWCCLSLILNIVKSWV